jgi:Zn-dependent M28 family amino/carboxypeptidase
VRAISILLIAAVVACGLIVPIVLLFSGASTLANQMSSDRMRVHLTRLEQVAQQNGGSRAPWTGYPASVAYVKGEIQSNTNLVVTTQDFDIEVFEELSPPSLTQATPVATTFTVNNDFLVAQWSGAGTLSNAPTVAMGEGCVQGVNLAPGSVALIARGNCSFVDKIANAVASGAAAVVVYNNVPSASPAYFAAGPNGAQAAVPVFSVTYNVGILLQLGRASVSLATGQLVATKVTTQNLCAETPNGDPNSLIVVGAHLDSVEDGAGINDDGSGSVAVLEMALGFAKALPSVPNKVRFCWWGAEEEGLLGSTYYVDQLTPPQRLQHKAYLNFDMIGSRNYISFVFDGSSAIVPDVRNASSTLTELFVAQFNAEGKPYTYEAFADSLDAANTDYGPFLFAGIPSGGLSTGASEMKTIAERSAYGGFANTPADSCYHRSCDTVENIDFGAMLQNARYGAAVLSQIAAQANLEQFLRSPLPPSAQSSLAVEQQDRQLCAASEVDRELLCVAEPRKPRLPRWANKA